jgi:hypothetical protein
VGDIPVIDNDIRFRSRLLRLQIDLPGWLIPVFVFALDDVRGAIGIADESP